MSGFFLLVELQRWRVCVCSLRSRLDLYRNRKYVQPDIGIVETHIRKVMILFLDFYAPHEHKIQYTLNLTCPASNGLIYSFQFAFVCAWQLLFEGWSATPYIWDHTIYSWQLVTLYVLLPQWWWGNPFQKTNEVALISGDPPATEVSPELASNGLMKVIA